MNFFLALSLAVLAPAAAQMGDQGAGDEAPAAQVSEPQSTMSLDDARMNFGTVIDSFMSARTNDDGFWPLKDKKTGKLRLLKLLDKDLKTIAPAEGGGGAQYTGRVSFKDQSSGERLKAEFLIDFGGSEWKVKQMKLIPPKKKKKAAAAPKTPAPGAQAPGTAAPQQSEAPQPSAAPAAAPPPAPN